MSKKTLTLISILIAIVAILIAISVSQKNALEQPLNTVNPPTVVTSPTVTVSKNTTLAFSPPTLSASTAPQQLTIIINSTDSVSAVQVELSYDPKKLTGVDIALPKTGGFFPTPTSVLLKNIDKINGRISFAVGIGPTQKTQPGTGTIAVLSFTPNLKPAEQTQITFLPKSLVTALGVFDSSVLKSTSNATIIGSAQ